MASQPSKAKHDWYQTETHVVIEVRVKGLKPESVKTEFGPSNLSFSADLPEGVTYVLDLDLAHPVVADQCSYKVGILSFYFYFVVIVHIRLAFPIFFPISFYYVIIIHFLVLLIFVLSNVPLNSFCYNCLSAVFFWMSFYRMVFLWVVFNLILLIFSYLVFFWMSFFWKVVLWNVFLLECCSFGMSCWLLFFCISCF